MYVRGLLKETSEACGLKDIARSFCSHPASASCISPQAAEGLILALFTFTSDIILSHSVHLYVGLPGGQTLRDQMYVRVL